MKRTIFYLTCIAVILASTASGKDYAGYHVLQHETGAVAITLQKDVSVPGHGPVGYGF